MTDNTSYLGFLTSMLFGNGNRPLGTEIKNPSEAQAGDIIFVDFFHTDKTFTQEKYMITKIDGDNIYVVTNNEGNIKTASWDEEGHPTFKIEWSSINKKNHLVFVDKNKYAGTVITTNERIARFHN